MTVTRQQWVRQCERTQGAANHFLQLKLAPFGVSRQLVMSHNADMYQLFWAKPTRFGMHQHGHLVQLVDISCLC